MFFFSCLNGGILVKLVLTIVMFSSSCDSTFGLGASNEDGLGWFASSDAIEGSRDRLRSDIQCQNSTSSALKKNGSLEVSRTEEMGSSISDSGIKSQPVSYNGNLWPSQKDELANLSHLSFVNGSSNSDCKLVPLKKVSIILSWCTSNSSLLLCVPCWVISEVGVWRK